MFPAHTEYVSQTIAVVGFDESFPSLALNLGLAWTNKDNTVESDSLVQVWQVSLLFDEGNQELCLSAEILS